MPSSTVSPSRRICSTVKRVDIDRQHRKMSRVRNRPLAVSAFGHTSCGRLHRPRELCRSLWRSLLRISEQIPGKLRPSCIDLLTEAAERIGFVREAGPTSVSSE